jgi:hypothetical protein
MHNPTVFMNPLTCFGAVAPSSGSLSAKYSGNQLKYTNYFCYEGLYLASAKFFFQANSLYGQ